MEAIDCPFWIDLRNLPDVTARYGMTGAALMRPGEKAGRIGRRREDGRRA
jgi:hypothetical protein